MLIMLMKLSIIMKCTPVVFTTIHGCLIKSISIFFNDIYGCVKMTQSHL